MLVAARIFAQSNLVTWGSPRATWCDVPEKENQVQASLPQSTIAYRTNKGRLSAIATHAMDIPKIGDHCSLASCRVNDFLPIRCKCEQSFCKDHIFPDSHNCPLFHLASDPHPHPSHESLQRCAFTECRKPSLGAFMSQQDQSSRSAVDCAGCKKSFCAR